MAATPSFVPPPPPPLSSLPSSRSSSSKHSHGRGHDTKNNNVPLPTEEVEQTIQRLPSWRLNSKQDSVNYWLACNQQVKHIGQEGPTCGLVALCMAANVLRPSGDLINADVILAAARRKGYTIQGEMFSASNMLKLAEEEYNLKGRLLTDGLESHLTDIIAHLARGFPVLVPYDKDSNNEPTIRNGHSAHWAVLTGFVMVLPKAEENAIHPSFHGDVADTSLLCLLPPWSDQSMTTLPQLIFQASQIFVFARQGKSRLLGAWSYDALVASNSHLMEYDPTLEGEFVFNDGGLGAGLAGKAILLQHRD